MRRRRRHGSHRAGGVVTADPAADAYAVLGTDYDAWCHSVTEDIDFYVRLAIECRGPVLEIGVGSGRIAVPTALAGIAVVGVDRSTPMLDLAQAKARAQGVSLVCGFTIVTMPTTPACCRNLPRSVGYA